MPRTKKVAENFVENISETEIDPVIQELKVNIETHEIEPVEADDDDKKRIKKHSRFYDTYIIKTLRQVSEHNEITTNARQQLNSILIHISRIISTISRELSESGKKRTISSKEIEGAFRIVFNGELKECCIKEGQSAAANYNDKMETEEKTGKKTQSRQNRAGIIFPPSLTERFLRKFGSFKVMLTSDAPVFMAAGLEYFTSELLELASGYSNKNNKIRITVRDLELAVRNDREFSKLFTKNRLEFIGGGVNPFIHSVLMVKKNVKRKTEQKKCRPGVVALRDIKRYQKIGDCLMFAKHPFEMTVRNIIANDFESKLKISKDVFLYLQYFLEQRLINLLQMANNQAIYARRIKLFPTDIEMVRSIIENRMPEFFQLESDNTEIYLPGGSVQIEINHSDEEDQDTFTESEDDTEFFD